MIWEIPEDYSFHKYVDEEDNIKDITEPVKVLSGHSRKVGLIEFHPCAENVLASSSLDYSVKIWNTETGKDEITLQHKDLVTSFAFNYNGSLLATCSRDKKLRIWDIRSGKIISEGPGHTGAKPSRVAWLGNTDRIVTTGFSRLSDRQVGIWDIHNIDKGPINGFLVIDSGSGVLIPHFDNETSILYIAGKGDGNIRYYEYDKDDLYELSQYGSTDPQRGFAVAPKHAVNVRENEVVKSFKTVFDHSIEPISFIVPRRSELFQADIYPDCPSSEPALSAEEWFGGKEVNGPLLLNMEAIFEGTKPEIRDSKPATVVNDVKKEAEKTKQEEQKKKEEEQKLAKETTSKDISNGKKEESVSREGTPGKNVDDLLKNSGQVNSLLSKVADQSDDEDAQNDDDDDENGKDDGWEEVKKPEVKSLSSSETEKAEPKKEEPKKEEPKKEEPKKEEPKVEVKKEEPKVEVKKEEPKAEPKAESKAEPKVEAKTEPKVEAKTEPKKEETKEETTKSPKPTLGSTIEKLASLVTQLESQVTKLTQAGLEKDERLAALEKKLDELLKK